MKDIVEYIVKHLVNNPDTVEINMSVDGDYNIINVIVPENELGKVIGKNGKIASSIRTIVRSSQSRCDKFAIKITGKTVE